MIIGHQKNRTFLKKILQDRKLPHAMIFAGTAGIGKKLVALELAQSMKCNEDLYGGCGQCSTCKPFLAGNDPDFYQIDCENKQAVEADQIREIINKLALKSFSGKPRILIFDNAEFLSIISSNILLKSLEEPRADTYYILVAANPSAILSTIRSRCQTYYFSDLTNQEIRQIYQENSSKSSIEEDDLKKLLPYITGNLRALDIILEDYKIWNDSLKFWEDLLADKIYALNSFLKPLAKDRDKLANYLFFMELIIHHELAEAKGKPKQRKLAILLQNILLARYYIFQRNLHATSLLTAIFADFCSSEEPQIIENYIVE